MPIKADHIIQICNHRQNCNITEQQKKPFPVDTHVANCIAKGLEAP